MIVVSSAAAWQPVPFMATYAATKAFELAFTEALAKELRGTGVRAIAVCPGPTATEFNQVVGAVTGRAHPAPTPEGVVAATWRALAAGRPRVATGWLARGHHRVRGDLPAPRRRLGSGGGPPPVPNPQTD